MDYLGLNNERPSLYNNSITERFQRQAQNSSLTTTMNIIRRRGDVSAILIQVKTYYLIQTSVKDDHDSVMEKFRCGKSRRHAR